MRQLIEDGAKNVRVLTTSAPSWAPRAGVETVEGSITKARRGARRRGRRGDLSSGGARLAGRGGSREMYAVHVEGTRLLASGNASRREDNRELRRAARCGQGKG